MEILQWEPSFSMWKNGGTDMMKLAFAFQNFAKWPEKGIHNFQFISKSPTLITAYDTKDLKKS